MTRAWAWLGKVLYRIFHPLLVKYLSNTKRTRVLVVCGDEILVLKGWLASNMWNLPGGGLNQHESERQGAARELYEETGIKCVENELKLLYQRPFEDEGFRYQCTYFILQLDEKPHLKRQWLEIVELSWIDHRKLTKATAKPDVFDAVATWFAS